MIVVDEQMDHIRVIEGIASWYPGKVETVRNLRRQTVIKDEAIPTLLHSVRGTTFITINVVDFWRKIEPHSAYCIINFSVKKERIFEIPTWLRQVLQLSEFRTKRQRMGKVIRVVDQGITYYDRDKRIKSVKF